MSNYLLFMRVCTVHSSSHLLCSLGEHQCVLEA